jgi:hypothetical protein
LRQLLRHLCRPSRPEGTPRLQGLYVFSAPRHSPGHSSDGGDCWYTATGDALGAHRSGQRSGWEETLVACQGIISFDAVLCTHMHADMAPVLHPASKDALGNDKPGIPPMASVALGPAGCAGCGRAPHGAPVWGESHPREFPLLGPPPWSGNLVDAVRPPPSSRRTNDMPPRFPQQRLIVSCTWCLTNRYCKMCHRWWCRDCFHPGREDARGSPGVKSPEGWPSGHGGAGRSQGDGRDSNNIKVYNSYCVGRCAAFC